MLTFKLINAFKDGKRDVQHKLRKELRELESRDPELIYKMEMEKLLEAKRDRRMADAELHSSKAIAARDCLPQLNLEGLWVGK